MKLKNLFFGETVKHAAAKQNHQEQILVCGSRSELLVPGYKRPREYVDTFDLWGSKFRVSIDMPAACQTFAANFFLYLSRLYDATKDDLVVLCIGTDRSTGDSLGPLVGTALSKMGLVGVHVYGSLKDPVHAVNLPQVIDQIRHEHPNGFIVAVDACLGRSESVKDLVIQPGPLQPGTGVNKDLPSVGDLSVMGIVNVGGFMEYMILQNTHLRLVIEMADIISYGIAEAVSKVFVQPNDRVACTTV